MKLGYGTFRPVTVAASWLRKISTYSRDGPTLQLAIVSLLPFLVLQMYFHPLIWIAALWVVTFPGATWSLAILFKRAAATVDTNPARLRG